MSRTHRTKKSRWANNGFSLAAGAAIPLFEGLESRLMLSGDVTVSVVAGSLRIKGDAADNDITITGGGGTFIISGNNGTTVNEGKGPGKFGGVTRDIRVWFYEGNDVLKLDGVDVPRDLKVYGGNGDNEVDIDPSSIGRDVIIRNKEGMDTTTIDDSSVGRHVKIYNKTGGSKVELKSDATVGGNLSISNWEGDDEFKMSGSSTDVAGKVTINNRDGGSKQEIKDGASIGGNVSVKNGRGAKDEFKMDGGKGDVENGG